MPTYCNGNSMNGNAINSWRYKFSNCWISTTYCHNLYFVAIISVAKPHLCSRTPLPPASSDDVMMEREHQHRVRDDSLRPSRPQYTKCRSMVEALEAEVLREIHLHISRWPRLALPLHRTRTASAPQTERPPLSPRPRCSQPMDGSWPTLLRRPRSADCSVGSGLCGLGTELLECCFCCFYFHVFSLTPWHVKWGSLASMIPTM